MIRPGFEYFPIGLFRILESTRLVVLGGIGQFLTQWIELERRFKRRIRFLAPAESRERAPERHETQFRIGIQAGGILKYRYGFFETA